MKSDELKEEIISMWKKGISISQISREKNISRPTIRKIVEKFKKNRKWHLVRTFREDNFIRLVVNTSHHSENKEGTPIERLANGVEHWELKDLIRSIVKREVADEITFEFVRDPPRISILYIRESELLPEIRNNMHKYH